MKIIKFLSTLLALIFIFSAFPLAAFAEGDDETEDAAVTETVDERTEIERLVCNLVLIAGDRSDE